jgi:hypothetical protein
VESPADIGKIAAIECDEGLNRNFAVRQDVSDYSVHGAEVPVAIRRPSKLIEGVFDHVFAVRFVWQ